MKHIFALLSLFLSITAFAQHAGKISGKIVHDQKPVAGASLSLIRMKDTSVIKLAASATDGSFAFENLVNGKYRILVSAVGYKKTGSPVVEITNEKSAIQFPPVNLVQLPNDLGNVTVTAQKPLIEQKIDRTIINVDASVTNVGSSAFEILEKSPGITIDKDGNISLKGKEGVLVMVDGRPTQLSAADLANMLRNMNANQLDQVEIMTNPPAKYDAAGNAGIINIKTKKMINAGYNGTFTLGYIQGKYPKINEGFNFNYRKEKLNVFTNLSHNYRKNFEDLTIQRNLYNNSNQLQQIFDQAGDKRVQANSYNIKFGVDYFATKKTTFGIVLNGASSPSAVTNDNITNIYSSSKNLESITLATVNNNNEWKSYSANINFRTALNKGKELTADLDHMVYDAKNNQFMQNAYFNAAGSTLLKADTLIGSLPQTIKLYSGRVDYLHPINKNSRFEAGIKSSIVRTDNDARYDSIQNGVIVHDYNRSNHFIYTENINAVYANLSTSLSKKINAQFGLRLENTNAKGEQLTTGQVFNRHYIQLFPTAFLQYKANANNNFGLSYGRRIRRPDYNSLNPFIRFIDRYTYNKGNPDLQPQFSNNIELSHSYKNFLTTTLNYTVTKDILQSVIEQKGQEAYQTQQNIASLSQVGIAVSLNKQLNKRWNNNIAVNAFHNKFSGVVNTTPISFSATSFTASTTQQIKLSGSLTAELNAKYRSGMLMGVLRSKPVGVVIAGLSKQIMNNNGTIRVSIRDVFYTQRLRATANYGNVDMAFQEVGDSRAIVIGFSYRFAKGKNTSNKKRTAGSAGEEQERIGLE
jgi:outer membrane receptor protein involved in Fe transport